jgi:hypothetical protein
MAANPFKGLPVSSPSEPGDDGDGAGSTRAYPIEQAHITPSLPNERARRRPVLTSLDEHDGFQ